ncbi:nodulation S family protein [Actinoplanes sp. KI2]|uniref:nodulation S family protein n=1 Tax=Actinoplanes sp. KI2 TaxID=2983315 RepID=UPI0021D56C89|nr:nodulation S family protein [Actinoplanes sp. KI2]MCU7729275.1 nodulation S family protein [Actinoplanes sp. KI2]
MTRAQGDPSPPDRSVSLDHFIGMYEAKTDPWDNATKRSDQRKYAVALASLPRARYRRAYEPGCAVGLFTRQLAPRCDELLAVDAVPEAVRQAAAAVREFPHVTVEQAVLPADLPAGTFDLIVIGDLLYYLSGGDLAELLSGLRTRLEPGGEIVAMHYRDRTGATWDGAHVHDALAALPGLERVVTHDDEWFLLDVLRLRP